MDSDTPNHPTGRRVLRRAGNQGFGALVRLWCFAAQFGKAEPGRCVDSDGDPVEVEDLIDASGLNCEEFHELIEVLRETKCIDIEAWNTRKELAFPGMTARADEYTKKVRRNSVRVLSGEYPDKKHKHLPTRQDSTEEYKTEEQGKTPAEVFAEKERARKRGNPKLLMEWWNDITKSPIPRCRGLNAKRIKACQRVMDEFKNDVIKDAFHRISSSKFCQGENERGWKASFDWVLQPDSILRTLEGKYQDRTKTGTTRSKSGKYDNVERGDLN
jgi:hypothetical protein|tara:strand:+ start:1225 stop:2040 length:816 start_codon:yes stop_codon:yes gene_type:complete